MKEKKKRVSKKNKSSWRKHVDVKDVDDFLEDQRLEERLGEPFSALKDEQLFTVTTGVKEEQLSTKEKKKLRLLAPPKCFSMLQSHTKVPDPIRKRNRVRSKEERMCPILKKKEHERMLNGIFKPREMQSMIDRYKHKDEKLQEKEQDKFCKDIWDVKDQLNNDDWLEKNTKRHTLRGLGKLNKIVPKMKSDKNVAIANVEIPHPGMSYNPSFKDHNDLLMQIVEKETKIMKQEAHIQRVTKDMFRRVPAEQTQSSWMIEMSQGLPENATEMDEDLNNVADDTKPYKSVNAAVVNKKKTSKQRRKQKEQLKLREQLLLKKLEKKKTADLHKLKAIKQQIESLDRKLVKQRERKEKLKSFKKNEPKQLGRLKYEDPDIEFSMPENLTGNLRNVKSEGNLLADRFHSMQKRNILPVTVRHNRKKTKVRKFVKPGFKDDWKKTVASSNIFPTK